ncbi:MAG: DUF2207 family protein [Actinomycetota bacterium]
MRRTRRLVTLAFAVVTVVLGSTAPAFAKSYHFTRVLIDATVLPDGSLQLVEQRTYDFSGDFHGADYTIDWPSDKIEDFTVAENGKELNVESNPFVSPFHAVWSYAAADEQRTFTISYRADCAVDVFSDTAHLLWQFVGTGWTVPTDFVKVTVHLPGVARNAPPRPTRCAGAGSAIPGISATSSASSLQDQIDAAVAKAYEDAGLKPPKGLSAGGNHGDHQSPPAKLNARPLKHGEVRAWGHGPFNGNVSIPNPNTVVYTVRNLEPGIFVEGSIVFPPDVVPLAPQQKVERLQGIIAHERELAAEANARRHLHEVEANVTRALFVLVPLVMLLLVVISRLRDREPGVPEILREPPEPPEQMHPVDLARIWGSMRGRRPAADAYRAEILYLAQSGVIELAPVGLVSDPEDFTIKRKKDPTAEGDLDFIDFLFSGDGTDSVSLKDLEATGKRRNKLRHWWSDMGKRTESVSAAIRNGQHRWESFSVGAIALVTIAWAIYAGAGIVGPFAYWLIPLAVVGWIASAIAIRSRLKPELRERMARWRAFRRFLKKFSSLPDAPAMAVIIWERYLVYATALGIAKTVEKQVKALVPPEELPAPFPGAPPGMGGYQWNAVFIRSISTHESTTTAAALGISTSTSHGGGSWSSGGGFGGGFSGGGGGGGGGTGGGAW